MVTASTTLKNAMTSQIATPRLRIKQKSKTISKVLNMPSYMNDGNFYKPEWHLGSSYLYLYVGVSGIETFHALPLSEIYSSNVTVTPTAGFTVSRGHKQTGPYHIKDNGSGLDLYAGLASAGAGVGVAIDNAFGRSYAILYRSASYDLSTLTGASVLARNNATTIGVSAIAFDPLSGIHSPIETIYKYNNTIYAVENNNINSSYSRLSTFNHVLKYVTGASLTSTGITLQGFVGRYAERPLFSREGEKMFQRFDDYPTSVNLTGSSDGLFLYYQGMSSNITDDSVGNLRFESFVDRFRLTKYNTLSDRTRMWSTLYDYEKVGDDFYGDMKTYPRIHATSDMVSISDTVRKTESLTSRKDTYIYSVTKTTTEWNLSVWKGNKKTHILTDESVGHRRLYAYNYVGSTAEIVATMDASGRSSVVLEPDANASGGITMSVSLIDSGTELNVINYTNTNNETYNLSIANTNAT